MCLSLVYLFIKVYWFAEYFILVCIHWSSWDSQQVDPSRTLSLNCDTPPPAPPPFTGLAFLGQSWHLYWKLHPTFASAQDPPGQTPVGPIVLISRLALFDLRGHVYLGPFHRKWRLRFCFSCGDLKKKSKIPVKVGISLDISSCWRACFSLSTLPLNLWTRWSSFREVSQLQLVTFCYPKPHSWPKWAYRPASSWPESILSSPSSHTQARVTSNLPLKLHEILEQIIYPKTLPHFFALLTFLYVL